jgi:serine/threonine protein kinase
MLPLLELPLTGGRYVSKLRNHNDFWRRSLIGRRLAQYEITAKLGQGGLGEVYRARDPKLGRDVALKLLPQEFAQDRERLLRFEREARILASLNHANVATIHGFEQDGDHHFLVMELVEGEDLSQRLRRGRMEMREAVTLASQIARGLEAAHEQGIVHRDLKPANIKVTAEGSIKVLDFGLASMEAGAAPATGLEDSPTIAAEFTEAGTILGTAPYMSPEQAKGQPAGARTDIWAFGCVLYEMLTGVPAFKGGTLSETIAVILEREPDWSRLPETLPNSVRTLLRRCLAKDVKQRLHSTADIRIELEEAFDQAPALTPTGTRTPTRRIAGIAAVAFVLGAAVVAGVLQRASSPTVDTKVSRVLIPTSDVVPLPESSSIAIAPNGEFVVYVGPAETRGTGADGDRRTNLTQLYLRRIDEFTTTAIDGTVGATAPFISPDSQWIGFMAMDLSIKKVSETGGTPTVICGQSPVAFREAVWAEGDQIYLAGAWSGIETVSASGGERRPVALPKHEDEVKTYRFPSLVSGANALLFTLGRPDILTYDDATVAVLSLETGEIKELLHGGMSPSYVASGNIVYGRAGKLFAIRFDPQSLEVTGQPVEVLDAVVTSDGYGSAHFDVSEDGTLVYIFGGPEQFTFDLFISDFEGKIERIPQPSRLYGNVRVSPDGKRMLLSDLGANASIWVYELERGTMSRLISGWDNHAPIWHPSENRFAFGTNRTGRETLWLWSASGSEAFTPLGGSESMRYPSSWSHDGGWIAATWESSGGASDIRFIRAMDDGMTTRAIDGAAAEYSAAFSPDGRFVAYISDESGQTEIYVQTFPVTGQKWKISENGGDAPIWSPDGRSLYYLGSRHLIEVPLLLEPDFRPGRARELFELKVDNVSAFDVFPDGEHLVMIAKPATGGGSRVPITRPEGGQNRMYPAGDPNLHVVFNWSEELEAKTQQ